MSESLTSLQRKINSANDLQSVVRTMKAMAAARVGQYEKAVGSLDDYYLSVQLGLTAFFHSIQRDSVSKSYPFSAKGKMSGPDNELDSAKVCAIVFGSDQGLVGQFNEYLITFIEGEFARYRGLTTCWPVGERIRARLQENTLNVGPSFDLPKSITSITQLISEVLIETDTQWTLGNIDQVYLFFNHPTSKASYQPVCQRLLPLDHQWQTEFVSRSWPTLCLPELINGAGGSLRPLIHEYLFVSIFRACAESLASENASRLIAMQRAEKNIEEIQQGLHRSYHQKRQNDIDEELSDLVSGFEASRDL